MKKESEFVSWASVNNVVPIVISGITTVISIMLFIGTINTRMALLEQKQDVFNQRQGEILSLLKGYQLDNQQLSLKVERLETLVNSK